MNYSKPISLTAVEHELRESERAAQPPVHPSGLWRLYVGFFLFIFSLFLVALATGLDNGPMGNLLFSQNMLLCYEAETGSAAAGSSDFGKSDSRAMSLSG